MTYIYHKFKLNVGKYSIHGASGHSRCKADKLSAATEALLFTSLPGFFFTWGIRVTSVKKKTTFTKLSSLHECIKPPKTPFMEPEKVLWFSFCSLFNVFLSFCKFLFLVWISFQQNEARLPCGFQENCNTPPGHSRSGKSPGNANYERNPGWNRLLVKVGFRGVFQFGVDRNNLRMIIMIKDNQIR